MKLLLAHGANLQAKDWANQTPFFKAVEEGHFGVVKYLIDYHSEQIDLNIKRDVDNKTVLHLACEKQFVQMIFYLVAHGANINMPDVVCVYFQSFERTSLTLIGGRENLFCLFG